MPCFCSLGGSSGSAFESAISSQYALSAATRGAHVDESLVRLQTITESHGRRTHNHWWHLLLQEGIGIGQVLPESSHKGTIIAAIGMAWIQHAEVRQSEG